MKRASALILLVKIIFSASILLAQTERIELIKSSQSVCDERADARRIKPRIISMAKIGDTLELEVGFAATCCVQYNSKLRYVSDTLYLSYEEADDQERCACGCCYSFYHKIAGVKTTRPIIKIFNKVLELSNERYYTYPPTYVLFNGDTINRKDRYGLEQGIWFHGDQRKRFDIMVDDHLCGWGHCYENGNKKDEVQILSNQINSSPAVPDVWKGIGW